MRALCRVFSICMILGGVSRITSAAETLSYNDKFMVYTSDAKGYALPEVEPLFRKLLQDKRPVVLFIHGRGDEPSKSLKGNRGLVSYVVEGKAIAKIEAYGTAAVLFSWNSVRGKDRDDREQPLKSMPTAGDRFARVLERIEAAVKALDQSNIRRVPMTLLAHSMGTIVLETYIAQNNGWLKTASKGPLFSTVTISSADADNVGHADWVNKLAKVERVYVTVNQEDWTLNRSTKNRQRNAHALGIGPGKAVSDAATYVHVKTQAHEIFAKHDSRPEISKFFSAVFMGQEVSLKNRLDTEPGRQFRLSR